MFEPSHELLSMMSAARTAGAGLMQRFRKRSELTVMLKGPADFVSLADQEAEETLRSLLLKAHPGYGFFAEEGGATPGGDDNNRFIVDPLDGTTNFLSGIPHFAISVGLERAGRVVAGLVFDPVVDEMFVGERGRGAWLGQERLHVSNHADFSRAVVGTGIPHANRPPKHEEYLAMLAPVMREAAGIRRMSAAALDLAYVASGRFAAFFEFGLAPWDLAAGTLLVEEAGGRVTTPTGDERVIYSGSVLATNGRLHQPMMDLLRRPA